MQKWSSGDVVTAKLSLAVFDILCYNKMNYADKTKYPRTTARGEIQDVNKMGSRKPMKLNLGMAPKVIFIMMLDVLATVVSFFLGLWFRYDFSFAEIRPVHMEGFLSAIGLWCVITLLVFWIFRLYNSIWAFVSTPEVFRITGAYVVLGVIGVLVFHFDGNLMPRSSMVVGFLFSFVSTVAIRFSYRLLRTAQRRISHITHANGVKNVMLIGAGDAGRALAVEFTNSDHIQDHLSCVIDDNPVKWNKQLCGVPIVGGRQDIATAVKKYKISKIIFAIPNCTAKSRKEILDICATTGCEVQMLPGIFQMVNGEVSVSKLRKVDPQDLLGREPIKVNLDEIVGYISGKVVLVTEDIRNGNGRAIKSKLWSPNRVDKIESPVNAIFWIMKDPTIPPIVKLKGASLASVMGATLATKRSSAERLKEGVDPNALVVEPYANPFRTYPLVNDYEKFKKLVAEKNVACYIINTGDFMGKKVQKEDTLGILESVVEGRAEFKPWGPFSDIEIMEWDGFVPDLTDKGYVAQMQARMQDRLNYVEGLKDTEGGFNALPDDAADAIRKVVEQANSL